MVSHLFSACRCIAACYTSIKLHKGLSSPGRKGCVKGAHFCIVDDSCVLLKDKFFFRFEYNKSVLELHVQTQGEGFGPFLETIKLQLH